ncbi:MAG: hypothetical protein ACOYMB_02950 [Patescibacteria group bacterium]
MKKILVVLVAMSFALILKAQTTVVAFENTSRSETVKVKIADLFDGEYVLVQGGQTLIKIQNSNIIPDKEYDTELFFSECGGYTQMAKIKIAKTVRISDLRSPCTADGGKGKIIPKECKTCGQDSVWGIISNESNSEFEVISDIFKGLTLAPGQTALRMKIGLGNLNITLKTYKDTTTRKVEIQSVISRFIVKDSTCIYYLKVKTSELSAGEDLQAPRMRYPQNQSSIKVSFVDENFIGATLSSGETAKRKYCKELPSGFIPATVEFLKDGVRTRVNLYKHLGPKDRYYPVTDEDLGIIKAVPESNKNRRVRR